MALSQADCLTYCCLQDHQSMAHQEQLKRRDEYMTQIRNYKHEGRHEDAEQRAFEEQRRNCALNCVGGFPPLRGYGTCGWV